MNIADINTFTRFLCSATSSDYTDAQLLIAVNNAYERVVGKLIGVNGDFQFDDSNFTTTPVGIGNLVSAQKDYAFDSSLLDILGVSVMDANGKYQKLEPIDQRDMGVDPSQFESTSGMPKYYDKNGTSIYLYPTPVTGSVTLTSGLKVFFQRTADKFTSAQVNTGTKEPGFMSTYHEILCYMAAIPYCMAYKKDRVAGYQTEVLRIEGDMLSRYARRSKDEPMRLSIKQESCR